MKKIINNRKYDTDTAEVIGEWGHGAVNDFAYQREILYRKKTGEYFLYGEGGAMSDYRTYSSCNSWGGGEVLIPYSEEDAKEWAMQHMDPDDYETEFGEVEE